MSDVHREKTVDVEVGGMATPRAICPQRRARIPPEDWPNPPPSPNIHANVAGILLPWARSQGVEGRRLAIVEGLLDREYLLSLPLPPHAEGFEAGGVAKGRKLRYLFRRHLAAVLNWRERREEGQEGGIPDDVNGFLPLATPVAQGSSPR
jgi:hypothetical protein